MTLVEWQRRAELPLAVAAVLFLISYSWIVLDPTMPDELRLTLQVVDYGTWAIFAVDYVGRVILAERRWNYVLHHLVDLLIVVLPLLRPLRLLRLLALLKFIERRVARSLQGRVAVYVVLSTTMVLYAGALAELEAERHAEGSNIHTFSTALWWAITTITTVGYGDHYPVTTQGRLIAAALMIAGVALLGVVTASLASWLVQRVQQPQTSPTRLISRDIELETLRAEVTQLRARLDPTDPTRPDPSG